MKALRFIVDSLFPARCHACDEELMSGERFVCSRCIHDMVRTRYHSMPDNPMAARFAGLVPFERATAQFFYRPDSDISRLVQDFKYRKFPGIARKLGHISADELLPTGFFYGVDALVPVPMHWSKRVMRGYNQAAVLAKGIAEATGLPVIPALFALRGHTTQTRKTHAERRMNMAGIFAVEPKIDIAGKHLLLVDDVCTTGSTLLSAAEALIAYSSDVKVSFFALTVTP